MIRGITLFWIFSICEFSIASWFFIILIFVGNTFILMGTLNKISRTWIVLSWYFVILMIYMVVKLESKFNDFFSYFSLTSKMKFISQMNLVGNFIFWKKTTVQSISFDFSCEVFFVSCMICIFIKLLLVFIWARCWISIWTIACYSLNCCLFLSEPEVEEVSELEPKQTLKGCKRIGNKSHTKTWERV